LIHHFLKAVRCTGVIPTEICLFRCQLGSVELENAFVWAPRDNSVHLRSIESLPFRIASQTLVDQREERLVRFLAVCHVLPRHLGNLKAYFDLPTNLWPKEPAPTWCGSFARRRLFDSANSPH